MAINIARRRHNLQLRLERIQNELEMLKTICKHTQHLTYKDRGDTGNYDPSDNSYWREWYCHECGAQWITEQSREELDKYPYASNVTR